MDLSLANAAVDGARKATPKTRFNIRKFQQRHRTVRDGRERLDALIHARSPDVLDLENGKGVFWPGESLADF